MNPFALCLLEIDSYGAEVPSDRVGKKVETQFLRVSKLNPIISEITAGQSIAVYVCIVVCSGMLSCLGLGLQCCGV